MQRINHVHPLIWLFGVIIGLVLFAKFMPHARWHTFWIVLKSKSSIITLLLVFSVIAVSLVWSAGQFIDAKVFKFLNKNLKHTPALDGLMLGVTQLGNGLVNIVFAAFLFIGVHHLLAYELIFGTLTLWLVVELFKLIINRTRPYKTLEYAQVVGSKEPGSSFPSGHTSQAFFTITLIIHYFSFSGYASMVLYFIGILVAVTRIYVGAHYPRDVFAGALLGTLWGLMGILVNSYLF